MAEARRRRRDLRAHDPAPGYVTLHDRPVVPQQAQRTPQRADVEVGSDGGVSQVIDLTVGETQLVMVYNGDLRL